MVYPYCSACKGTRDLCKLGRCPLLDGVRSRVPELEVKGRVVDGPSPPSVFVGTYGYPRISIGPMAPPLAIPGPERLESSSYLYGREVSEIYSFRSSLIRGKHKLNVKMAKDPRSIGSERLYDIEKGLPLRGRKVLSATQDLAMSARSVDIEMSSIKDLSTMVSNPTLGSITMPMGPSIDVNRVSLLENPSVPLSVEKATSDTDQLASSASLEMYGAGVPIEHIIKLLSIGLLGEGKRRRLIPTRWAITALDDTLFNERKGRLSDLANLDGYRLYMGEKLGNHFLVILFPPPFRFEMLEQWQRGSLWGEGDIAYDREGPRGRRRYASSITGAYYAARLSILDHLFHIGRNAGATVLRWITDEYWAPLGVWVIRETVRRLLETRPEVHPDREGLVRRIDELGGIARWRTRCRFLTGGMETTLEEFSS